MKKFFKYITILFLIFTLSAGLLSNKTAPVKYTMTATKYFAGDGCGFVMACGDKINVRHVEKWIVRDVALSPDMYDNHGFNFYDTIYVESDNRLIKGKWVVKDKTAKRFRKRIDFLMTRNNSKNFNKEKVKIYLIGKYKEPKKKNKKRK